MLLLLSKDLLKKIVFDVDDVVAGGGITGF